MIHELEITEPVVRDSVFIFAARKCPPSESQVRGAFEILAHFMDVTEPDPRLIQSDGTPVDGWESRTAILELQKIIGCLHPLYNAAIRALRDEVR